MLRLAAKRLSGRKQLHDVPEYRTLQAVSITHSKRDQVGVEELVAGLVIVVFDHDADGHPAGCIWGECLAVRYIDGLEFRLNVSTASRVLDIVRGVGEKAIQSIFVASWEAGVVGRE
jgi:hypothetical protein